MDESETSELALVLALLERASAPDTAHCRWCGALMLDDERSASSRRCMHVGGHERGWVDDVEVRDLIVLAKALVQPHADVSAALEVAVQLKTDGCDLDDEALVQAALELS